MTDQSRGAKGRDFLKTSGAEIHGFCRYACQLHDPPPPRVLLLPVLRMDAPSVTNVRRRDALVRMRRQLQVVCFQSFIKGNSKTFKTFLMPLGMRCMTRVTSEMKMKKKRKEEIPPQRTASS